MQEHQAADAAQRRRHGDAVAIARGDAGEGRAVAQVAGLDRLHLQAREVEAQGCQPLVALVNGIGRIGVAGDHEVLRSAPSPASTVQAWSSSRSPVRRCGRRPVPKKSPPTTSRAAAGRSQSAVVSSILHQRSNG